MGAQAISRATRLSRVPNVAASHGIVGAFYRIE
jgi:hypothetical protein